ncbi:MAG: YibE/F family protein [Synergistaceae bacterium]|nr:YibE/F family protein [Synergistaceae bacterium]
MTRLKSLLLRLALTLFTVLALYSAADDWTLRAWNNDESLVVRILEMGPESPVETEDGEAAAFPMLRREIRAQLLTGEQKGTVVEIPVVRLAGSGVDLMTGWRYLLVADTFQDGTTQYSIADAYRVPSLVAFVSGVCLMLVALSGWAGFLAILGLALSISVLVGVMIPLISEGWPPVPVALASVLTLSALTILCVVRRPRTRIAALLGSLGGVCGGFLLGTLMVWGWQLTGLAGEGAALLASTLPGIDMRGILLSAVLVGAIGAVLDVGVSVTASMAEFVDYDPNIPLGRLLLAGLNVGSEVLGSMINTLIFAYLGSSLPMAILISGAGVDLMGLLNDLYIGQEVVQSLAGTVGLLLTIPATASVFAAQEAWSRRRRGHEAG